MSYYESMIESAATLAEMREIERIVLRELHFAGSIEGATADDLDEEFGPTLNLIEEKIDRLRWASPSCRSHSKAQTKGRADLGLMGRSSFRKQLA